MVGWHRRNREAEEDRRKHQQYLSSLTEDQKRKYMEQYNKVTKQIIVGAILLCMGLGVGYLVTQLLLGGFL